MPEAIQGLDPEENDKLVKNVVPEEPKNERLLDLDDWSNRCIYHEAPETETDKLDFDDWSNRPTTEPETDDWSTIPLYHGTTTECRSEKSSVTASEPRQCKDAKPAEDGKFAKDINKVTNVIVLGSE
uniref:Uncharacterized protein n=1 Tax=Populus trichocarpa TaxID=3694 RepID=B9HRQ2_POPTR